MQMPQLPPRSPPQPPHRRLQLHLDRAPALIRPLLLPSPRNLRLGLPLSPRRLCPSHSRVQWLGCSSLLRWLGKLVMVPRLPKRMQPLLCTADRAAEHLHG